VLAVAALSTACGSQTADYSSIWTTSETSSVTTTSATERPVPIAEYLASIGVTGQQIALDKLTDLKVTLPRPAGWSTYANPNYSPGTEAIAKGNYYPMAMVLVFALDGNFDVTAALKHADASAELSKNFTRLNSSGDDFGGFPSSMIEGSYDLADLRLHSYNRIVFPVTPAPNFKKYLVQFTVTTLAEQAAAAAPEVGQVINGFAVAVK